MEKNTGKSVGAIITDVKGRYLVQYRLKIPVGLALPAGHIEEGESPEEALQRREVQEELGLRVETMLLCFQGFLNNPCPKDHSGHDWWVYFVTASGTPELKEPTKHKFVKWMNLDEIHEYVNQHKSDPEQYPWDPAWFEHILPALKII